MMKMYTQFSPLNISLLVFLSATIATQSNLDLQHQLDAILDKPISMGSLSAHPTNTESPMKYLRSCSNGNGDCDFGHSHITHLTHCTCSAKLDPYGDHCLGCTDNHKTAASDCIRDAIVMILKRILPLVQLIRQQSQVETEPPRTIKDLPKQRPFDLAFLKYPPTYSDEQKTCGLTENT